MPQILDYFLDPLYGLVCLSGRDAELPWQLSMGGQRVLVDASAIAVAVADDEPEGQVEVEVYLGPDGVPGVGGLEQVYDGPLHLPGPGLLISAPTRGRGAATGDWGWRPPPGGISRWLPVISPACPHRPGGPDRRASGQLVTVGLRAEAARALLRGCVARGGCVTRSARAQADSIARPVARRDRRGRAKWRGPSSARLRRAASCWLAVLAQPLPRLVRCPFID